MILGSIVTTLLATITIGGNVPRKSAVDELKTHLKLIGGENVEFHAEFDPAEVGNREGCAWEWTPEKTVFRGNALFAVVDFLENGLGVRWPDGATISYRPMAEIKPAKPRGEWVPKLRLRSIRIAHPGSSHAANSVFRRRMRQGGHDMPAYGHAFPTWWAKYGKEHREYFAMRPDGLRGPTNLKDTELVGDVAVYEAKTGTTLGMCVSSTGLVNQIVANWLAAGTNQFINICENDIPGGSSCHCESCRALDEPPPAGAEKLGGHEYWHADRYVWFEHRVLEAARRHRPDVRVVYYAYNGSQDAPRRERVDPAAIIGIVPTRFDRAHLDRYVGGWKKMGMNEFFYRPNRHHYYLCPFLPTGQEQYFFDLLGDLVRMNAIGFDYDAHAAQIGGFEWFEQYLLYHAMQDPSRSFDYWVDHYCSAFGAAAEDVKAYYRFWREEKWAKTLCPAMDVITTKGRYYNFGRGLAWNLRDYYSREDFATAERFLAAAEDRSLGESQATALRHLRLAHEHAKLYFEAVVERSEENAKRLLDFRRANGIEELTWAEGYWGDITGVKALKAGKPVKPRHR